MIAPVVSTKPTLDYYNVCRNAMRHIQTHGGKNFGAYQLVFAHISDLCNLKPWGPKLNSSKLVYLLHEGATVKGELSWRTGYTPRSITTMLRGLEKMGVIRCTRQAGKELSIEMLMGFIGARNRTNAVDDKESEFAVDATRKPQHIDRPARTRRQRDNAPAEVAEEPYQTIIQTLEATGFIRLHQRDIMRAVELAPVYKLESENLLAWLVEQLTERVRCPSEWLSARFREWKHAGDDYVSENIRRQNERKRHEFHDELARLLDGVDVRCFSEDELGYALEGCNVPFDDPRFNEVSRQVAEQYQAEHGLPILIGQLFESVCVALRRANDGAFFLSDSEAASK